MKNYLIAKLFFWKWYSNFYNAISQRHLYLGVNILDYKLKAHFFFLRMKIEVFPSYGFWSQVRTVLDSFTAFANEISWETAEKEFIAHPEKFLRRSLVECVNRWKFFPQMFRDFWVYYPHLNVPFDHVECIYLDFYFELPKVIDSLLSELLVRDSPVLEKLPADPEVLAWEKTGLVVVMDCKDVLPPISKTTFSEDAFVNHIVEYLSGEDTEKVFLKVVNFYLSSRPRIKEECSSLLRAKALPINDTSLTKCFLGEYIFKGVSNEGKRFFMSNSDLAEKNPFKKAREARAKEWSFLSEEEKQRFILRSKKALERIQKEFFEEQSLTVEERKLQYEAANKRRAELDINSLPRISLSKFVNETSDKGLG